jgi:hypothetical protein
MTRAFLQLMVGVGVAAALFMWPLPGSARDTSVFANPYPCSVLNPHPCHPTFCSVFSHHPCQPDINYPFGQDLRLTIKSRVAEPPEPRERVAAVSPPDGKTAAEKNEDESEHRLNTIGDMFAALRSCWVPPVKDESRPGTQMSVRLSFKRDGEPVGPPRVTYVSPGTPADVRKTYLDAVTASLKRCTPLPFTRGLGGALAGRPIAIRFVDDRQ